MQEIDKQILRLESYKASEKQLNISISNAPISWHIYHSLMVIIEVCKALKKSSPDEYKPNFNFKRIYIFLLGKFPRGKVRAPSSVNQKESASVEEINKLMIEAKDLIQSSLTIHKNANFKHPIFGILNKKQTHEFLVLHTQHHIKIIEDILLS
ncbi:MAG: DUF1569 domain-containing protein [Bacteroidetes bacterium]|nr:MAG: DUF1569 domain-containing protein [Bacteroidota bacterium]MBL1144355.1 DUF1569 domain-containing protein [Bacteroidota bacterium]NOG57151.1 DUF1569 domain-containing protein [Bacteroidota bacterium]